VTVSADHGIQRAIPIYVINLDRRPDRMAAMDAQMRRLGLAYRRTAAIDGADPDAEVARVDQWRFVLNQKKRPVRSELACAGSHRKVWQDFLNSDAELALVLEDDVTIASDLPDILAHCAETASFDFLNLSSAAPYRAADGGADELARRGMVVRPSRWNRAGRAEWRRIEWRRTWRIFRLHPFPGGQVACECDPAPALGSGYVLSRRAARQFLAASERLISPIDLIWRHAGGQLIEAFLARPVICPTGGDTDIHGRFDQPRISLKDRLLRPFVKSRRLRRRLDVLWIYGWLRH
jgi:glycosyl transferase family 25